MLSLPELEAAAELVYGAMAPTPQIAWPLLAEACGCEVWVKHENHTPVGAFKVRGGLVYLEALAAGKQRPSGVLTATRGNHGQSVAFAAGGTRLPAVIVVPHGNSREKNASMRALGAELIEEGHDFQAAAEFAGRNWRRSVVCTGFLPFIPSWCAASPPMRSNCSVR